MTPVTIARNRTNSCDEVYASLDWEERGGEDVEKVVSVENVVLVGHRAWGAWVGVMEGNNYNVVEDRLAKFVQEEAWGERRESLLATCL